MTREVWITGIGMASSLGEGLDAHWQAMAEAENPRPVIDTTSFAPYPVHPMVPLDFSLQIPKGGDRRQMENWQRVGTYTAGLALDDAGIAGADRAKPAMYGGRTRGTGILDAGRGLEAKCGVGLQHERGGEILRAEAAVEMAEPDRIDIGRCDPGIRDRTACRLDDQLLDIAWRCLDERQVMPSDDAGCHGSLAPLAGTAGPMDGGLVLVSPLKHQPKMRKLHD